MPISITTNSCRAQTVEQCRNQLRSQQRDFPEASAAEGLCLGLLTRGRGRRGREGQRSPGPGSRPRRGRVCYTSSRRSKDNPASRSWEDDAIRMGEQQIEDSNPQIGGPVLLPKNLASRHGQHQKGRRSRRSRSGWRRWRNLDRVAETKFGWSQRQGAAARGYRNETKIWGKEHGRRSVGERRGEERKRTNRYGGSFDVICD